MLDKILSSFLMSWGSFENLRTIVADFTASHCGSSRPMVVKVRDTVETGLSWMISDPGCEIDMS